MSDKLPSPNEILGRNKLPSPNEILGSSLKKKGASQLESEEMYSSSDTYGNQDDQPLESSGDGDLYTYGGIRYKKINNKWYREYNGSFVRLSSGNVAQRENELNTNAKRVAEKVGDRSDKWAGVTEGEAVNKPKYRKEDYIDVIQNKEYKSKADTRIVNEEALQMQKEHQAQIVEESKKSAIVDEEVPDIYTGYPGKEGKSYKLMDNHWFETEDPETTYETKLLPGGGTINIPTAKINLNPYSTEQTWAPITQKNRLLSLNNYFNKEASLDSIDEVFTNFDKTDEKKYNLYKIDNGEWKRLIPGAAEYSTVSDKNAIDALNNRYGKDVKYKAAISPTVKPDKLKFVDINSSLTAKTEEDAVAYLEKKYEDYGFSFYQEGLFNIDRVRVTASNGKETTVNFDEKNPDEALKLRNFLEQNASKITPKISFMIDQKIGNIRKSFNADDSYDISRALPTDNAKTKAEINKYYNSEEYKNIFKSLSFNEMDSEVYSRNTDHRGYGLSDGPVYEIYKKKKEERYNITDQKIKSLYEQLSIAETSGNKVLKKQIKSKIETYLSKEVMQDQVLNYNIHLNDLVGSAKTLTTDIKQYEVLVENFNKTAETMSKEVYESQKKILEDKAESLEIRRDNISTSFNNIDKSQKKINVLAGEYVKSKAKVGSFLGGITNSFLTGIVKIWDTAIIGSMQGYQLSYGVKPYVDPEESKYYKDQGYTDQEIRNISINETSKRQKEALRSAVTGLIGSETTKEYMSSKNVGFFEKALYGVAESAPAMLASFAGPQASFSALASQSYSSVEDEMLDDPDFKGTSAAERAIVAIPYAILMGALENYGLKNAVKGESFTGGLFKGIISRSLKSMPEGFERVALEKVINKEVKSLIGKGIIRIVNGSLAEFETGATQSLVLDIGLKALYNTAKGKKMRDGEIEKLTGGKYFSTPDSFSEGATRVWEDGLMEAIGGMTISTFSTVTTGIMTGNISLYNEEDLKFLNEMSTDKEFKKIIVANLKADILKGKLTRSEADAELQNMNEFSGMFESIPDNISPEDQIKSINLVAEKIRLTKQREGKDPALVAAQTDRINEINNELKIISENATKETTDKQQAVTAEGGISEYQGTSEGQQEVGVSEGGQREATVNETDSGDSTIPSQVQEEVATYRAEEQAELLKAIPKIESYKVNGEVDKTLMPKTVLDKYNKIYNKYDKLISPLLETTGEITINKPAIATNTTAEVGRVKSLKEVDEDGATFNIDGVKYEGPGLVVPVISMNTTMDELTPEMISNFVEEHSDKIGDSETVKVGIYKFPNSNKVSIDLNILAPESSRGQAIEFGRLSGQESLFDMSTFENVKTGATGENPMEFTPKQFKEIAKALKEGRMPNVFGTQEVAPKTETKKTEYKQNLVTPENTREVASKQNTPLRQKIAKSAAMIMRALPGVKIYLHNNESEMHQALADTTGRNLYQIYTEIGNSAGSQVEGEIHINMENANETTMLHEAFHEAILRSGKSIETIIDFANGLKNIISDKAIKAKLDEFVSRYDMNPDNRKKAIELENKKRIADGGLAMNEKESDNYIADLEKPTKSDEFLTELGAIMAEAETELTTTKFQKFLNLINRIAKSLGLPVIIKSSATAQEAVDFINSMSRSLRTGEAISVSNAINVDTNELSIKQQKIGDFDVSYFEDANEFKKLVKEELVENNYDINKISGEVVAVHQPDNMFVGTLKNLDKEIFNGNGGVFYTSITGNVWASGAESSAKSLAKLINNSLAESTDGVGRLVLVRGTDSKMISSTEGVKASMSIIELLVDKGLINRSEFRSSLIRVGKKFNIDFSGKDSSAAIHKDIKEKFMDVKNSTFQKRGDFFDEVINDLSKTSKSATENIDGIRKALGSKRKISFSKDGIRDSIGDILTERLLKDLPNSHAYAIIEVTEPVTYRENKGHDSYPWILESKSKPKLKLLSDRNHAVKDGVFEMIDGSVVTQGKLGLAQRGMGIAKISEQPSKIKQQKTGVEGEISQEDGKNIFYPKESLGLKRSEMPQIRTRFLPILFDKLKNDKISFEDIDGVMANTLKPSQNEINIDNTDKFKKDVPYSKKVIVSSDNYIIDGHHRWYYSSMNDLPIDITKIDLPIQEALNYIRKLDFIEQDEISKIKQQKGITPENSSNYANLTEDDKGNFVFFHVGKNNYDVIKRSSGGTLVTSKEESRAIGKVGGLAMYYTSPESGESMVTGPSKYVVSVSPDKVYDFDSDPDNIIEEAKKRFNKEYPGQAFDTNTQLAYVTKIASEKGYDMTVAQWEDGTRAQTALELKPNDVQLSDGNTIVKQFEETYESNRKKGYKSVIPKSKYQRLKKLFDKINTERNKTSTYDALYRLAGEENKYSDSELSNLIMNSDISIEIKNELQDILNSKPESRKSIKLQKTDIEKNWETKYKGNELLKSGSLNEGLFEVKDNPELIAKVEDQKIVGEKMMDDYENFDNVKSQSIITNKNVGKALFQFKNKEGKSVIIMQKMPGKDINKMTAEEFINIPQEAYVQLYKDIEEIRNQGFGVDYGGRNIMYDSNSKTFKIIDISPTENVKPGWKNDALSGVDKSLSIEEAQEKIVEGINVTFNMTKDALIYNSNKNNKSNDEDYDRKYSKRVENSLDKKILENILDLYNFKSEPSKIKLQKTPQETRMDKESEDVFKESLDLGTTWPKATQNALDYIQKSKWYQDATDIEREQKVRDFKESKKQKLKKAPSIAKIMGKPKPNMVTVNEAAAFKDQLRLEAKAAREAKADLNSKRKSLSDAIKGMVKLGKLKVSQASTIIKRVSQVNLDNPVMVDRLIDYAAKVFERADYQERLDNAFSYRRDIKSLLKTDNQAQIVGMANEFAKIDPSMVENIDDYIAMAEIVKNAVAPSRAKKFTLDKENYFDTDPAKGFDMVLKQAANIEAVSKFVKGELEKQEQQLKDELLATNNDLLQSGVLSGNMTAKQIQEIVNALKDPEYKMDSKEKEKYMREYLSKRFESLASIVTDIIKTNQNPFTGEKVAISEKNRAIILDLLKVDLSEMSIRDAIFAVEAMDNFVNNGITSKLEGALSAYKGQLGLKQEIKSGKVARALKLYFSKKIGRYFATEFTPLPLMMERMFSGVKSGISVMRSMGLDLVINGVNKANYLHNKIINEYYEKFIKNSKTFHNPENIYERGMLSFLKRNVTGSLEEMKAETSRRIKMIQESIATLMNDGDESQKAMAEIYQKVFDKLDVSSGDIDVIDSRASKENKDAVDWWVSEWSKHYQDLYDVSLSVYNYDLGSDINYTPDRYKTIKTESFDQALTERNSSFLINMDHMTDKSQTGVLMQANRPKVMPEGRYISLDFDTNNSSSLKGALVDINTAAGIRQVDGFLNSKLLSKLIPVSEDRSVLIQRTNRYIRRAKGKIFIPTDLYKDVDAVLNFAASLGVGKALGGVLQSVKQTIPIAISTAINTGKFNMSNFEFNEWLNKAGMPISNRGIESLSTIESMDRRMEAKGTKVRDSLKWIQEKQQLYVKWFLSKPDVFIARSGFQSYYLQYMGEKSIDWANHTPNKDALNYAQAMVDRQQNISDPMLGGEFLTAEDGMKRMAKKILFPFASFGLNQKARLYSDIINMGSKTTSAEDRKIATKSATATIAEMLAYRAISVGIGYGFYKAAAAIISGFIGDDDDDDKENSLKWLLSATKFPLKSMVNDIVSPIQMTDRYVTMSTDFLLSLTTGDTEAELDELVKQENEIRSLKDQDPMTERQEEKFRQESKNKSLYQVGSKYDDNAGLGMISIASDLYKKIYDDYTLATTGEFQDDYKGNVTIKRIRPVEQDLMKNTLYFSALFAMGVLPKESDQMVTKVVSMIKKNAMSESEYEKYEDFKKEFKREPSPFEMGMIKSEKKYDYISKDIDWVNRGGGLNLSQGREYVKLLNIMGEVNGSALLEIKAGKTADQISKSMRAKL